MGVNRRVLRFSVGSDSWGGALENAGVNYQSIHANLLVLRCRLRFEYTNVASLLSVNMSTPSRVRLFRLFDTSSYLVPFGNARIARNMRPVVRGFVVRQSRADRK